MSSQENIITIKSTRKNVNFILFAELNTWNFYLYIMSLWSLFACMFYSMLPESPKYLVTRLKYDEAREILIEIYTQNTGKPAETYPVGKLVTLLESFSNSLLG